MKEDEGWNRELIYIARRMFAKGNSIILLLVLGWTNQNFSPEGVWGWSNEEAFYYPFHGLNLFRERTSAGFPCYTEIRRCHELRLNLILHIVFIGLRPTGQ